MVLVIPMSVRPVLKDQYVYPSVKWMSILPIQNVGHVMQLVRVDV